MKLYHVSPIDNEESIIASGLFPNSTNVATCITGNGETLQGKGLIGVYGFVELYDAEQFAIDNRGLECNAIFAFDVPDGCEVVVDPEYDGEAMFVVTDEPVMVSKIR